MLTRTAFPSSFPRQVSANVVRRKAAYQTLLQRPAYSAHFSIAQVLAVAVEALGESLLQAMLQENVEVVLPVISAIVEDHARECPLRQKDLQVNLVSNAITQLCHRSGKPVAGLFEEAERLIAKWALQGEFKLAVRQALFDRQAVLSRPLTIHPYV